MGLTIVDAGVVIGVLDAADAHHAAARTALTASLERGDALAMPASAYAEAMVGPARRGRDAVRQLNAFLADLSVEVEPITRQVGARAAELRARYGPGLRLPDALVLATAVHLRAERVLTTDARWPKVAVAVDVIA